MADDLFKQYTKEVMEHFMHPKNIGVIENADGVGEVGNPRCGDVMKLYIKIGKRPISANRQSHIAGRKEKNDKRSAISDKQYEEFIEDVKVQTLGCGAAIATSSMATEMIKGKSLEKALEITNAAVAKALGGLPPVKMHCSVLAKEGIKKAIEDYQSKKKK